MVQLPPKKLYIERNQIADNIWFRQEYFPGISASGSVNEIDYFAGIYSNDNKPEFDGAFKQGQFGIFSLGKDYAETLNLEKPTFVWISCCMRTMGITM